MPITIVIRAIYLQPDNTATATAAAQLDAVPVRNIVTIVTHASAAMRFNCIASHGGREARVAHIRGRRVTQQPIRRDHRFAAQVSMKVLPKHARDAVEGHRVGARVQEAGHGYIKG